MQYGHTLGTGKIPPCNDSGANSAEKSVAVVPITGIDSDIAVGTADSGPHTVYIGKDVKVPRQLKIPTKNQSDQVDRGDR